MMTRDEAFELLQEYVETKRVLKHSLAVEAAMMAYARKFGEDEDYWGLVGLLHDIDFEKYPDEHPMQSPPIFEAHGFDQAFIDAILSHGSRVDVPRDSNVKKALHAVDEMASFIIAIALMRPEKLEGLKAKSVKKKMKDKAFARAVNRDELVSSVEALGVDFAEHVDIIVEGLKEREAILEPQGLSLLD